MSTAEEFKAILELQNEIDRKLDEYIVRLKAIMDANKDKRIIAKIEGELYELSRASIERQAVESCRQHGGFYSEYRLVKLPEPIE